MRIGILTGGGDVPGLNACIRSVVLSADALGWEVTGFRRGWEGVMSIEPGDLMMICSDGLSSVVSLEAIETILKDPGPADLEATASALIDAANAGGGPDNITVVLVRVDVR